MSYRGMGEQPGYVCYDASRPPWLPYFFDTWGESTCKLREALPNIGACINPLSTQCSPDSYANANIVHGPLNPDPSLSGPGIVAPDEPSNEPAGLMESIGLKSPTFDTGNLIMWVGIGALTIFLLGRR